MSETNTGTRFWEQELLGAKLPDERFRGNLIKMCLELQSKPEHSFSAACGPAVRKSALLVHTFPTMNGTARYELCSLAGLGCGLWPPGVGLALQFTAARGRNQSPSASAACNEQCRISIEKTGGAPAGEEGWKKLVVERLSLGGYQPEKFWQVCNLPGSVMAVWQLFFTECFGDWREKRTAKLAKCRLARCKFA